MHAYRRRRSIAWPYSQLSACFYRSSFPRITTLVIKTSITQTGQHWRCASCSLSAPPYQHIMSFSLHPVPACGVGAILMCALLPLLLLLSCSLA
jgi:hypothetical protein